MSSEFAHKITDAELEVMKVLWRAGEALSANRIRDRLQSQCSWDESTIKTLIARLTTKGVLLKEKRKSYCYTPLISENEYDEWVAGNVVHKIFNGRAKDLLSALVRTENLTKSDIDELRQMFDEVEE